MILSRAPVRITLGGGGTDLESYYSKHGGFVISAAIDKYCSILASKRFYKSIRLSYSEMEIRKNIEDIKHPIFRESLRFADISSGIELHSVADVPANSGLGSSSSFTVALLNALHTYKREFITLDRLAKEACHIEIDVLGEPIGKQDQYIAAFGGITCLTFNKDGTVQAEPLKLSDETLDDLQNNLLFFFTGKERKASEILVEQVERSNDNDPDMEANLHQIKDIGLKTKEYLEKGQTDMLGKLMHEHWEAKKRRSKKMTDPFIDQCYQEAIKSGATGGKLIGAGGGGFLIFYCPNDKKTKVSASLKKLGLERERFGFDFDGARILLNTVL